MRDGSRWPVFYAPLVILLRLTLLQASARVGSSLAAPAASPGGSLCPNDTCTLLAFKKGLQDPRSLGNWGNPNLSLWEGVSWQEAADGVHYVKKLELSGFNISGTIISPLLQEGLTNLVVLNISSNNFTAELPEAMRICPALQILDLHNNSFSGPLPPVVSCDDQVNGSAPLNLRVFDVSGNFLSGPVPDSLFSSVSPLYLGVLNLSYNHFTGELPSSLFPSVSSAQNGSSLRSLTSIDLGYNGFTGIIPSSIRNCAELKEVKLSSNLFSGILFSDFGKLENLRILEVSNNRISTKLSIPTDGGSFVQLRSLVLGNNYLTGLIPENLGNLSNLEILELKYNNLSGSIPRSLAKLSKLEILRLQNNDLNGTIPVEFSQLNNLSTLSLTRNKLSGLISPQLSNCTKLRSIWLGQNYLTDAIPRELGNLTNLVVLSLYGNYFNQSIPAELGHLTKLVAFDLSWNHLSGKIPDSVCDLSRLQVLFLNNNEFTASMPSCLGNYSYLRLLDLSDNKLSGEFPHNLSSMSSNVPDLNSTLPGELISATYIQELAGQNLEYEFSRTPISFFFSNNNLTGQIPASLGKIRKLQQLRLNNNSLLGPIPAALGNAESLYALDLSHNYLSGSIPDNLTQLSFLSTLNLSFNNLSGQIPEKSQFLTFSKTSFLGNPLLCGMVLNITCSSKHPSSGPEGPPEPGRRPISKRLLPLYIILASAVVCVCFLGGLFIWSWIRGCSRRNSSLVSNDGEMYESKDDLQSIYVTNSSALPSLNPTDLALATENYNENNIIGDGGFGLVYRAVLNNGNGPVVAVKKLIEDGAQGQSEFHAEMRTLGKIKHRNLVCLLGYCSHGKDRILVYEYMKNGSLDTWLHCREEGMPSLDWRTRLKVARGAAEGLSFLHHGLSPSIIHRDIKASNILLDHDFEARLADFGLARSAKAYDSHVSTDFAGTAGYIPPEYSQASAATTKGDVYSFGVVLLEILTGRRPTDPFFRKREMSHVVTWISDMSMEDAIEKTLDMTSAASTDEMSELMQIACMCCQEMASKRPNMGQVLQMLEALERQQGPSRSPSVVPYDESMSSPRCR